LKLKNFFSKFGFKKRKISKLYYYYSKRLPNTPFNWFNITWYSKEIKTKKNPNIHPKIIKQGIK
jgi:hypothetical protein